MTYQNDYKCPPLINKRKKRGKAAPVGVQLIPVVEVTALE
jgi:NosR/NirI family transcriptional regulator, nitrous oxide reductase regulator